jgi:ArsR family transcriptional regulator
MAVNGFDDVVAILKSIAEPTRLRILDLLASGELNVKDLTRILGQSQPRISRHLRLLDDAALIQRYREGNWVYCRLVTDGPAAGLVAAVRALLPADAPMLARDRARLDAVKREASEAALAFFNDTAAEWDRLRALQAGEAEIESAILDSAGAGPFAVMLDLGTGTGRMLEVFAGRIGEGVGVDQSRPMLALARARLERAGLGHCQVRHGDIMHLPQGDAAADLVVLHQVLHYFDDPLPALEEATRVLKPGGRLVVVDFAPHELEFLRTDFAHRRLGYSRRQMAGWFTALGLKAGETTDIVRMGTTPEGNLTVTVWVADRAG